MAVRKPLVLVGGQPQQLQPGDTLQADSSLADVRGVTNGEASAALVIGTPAYLSGSSAVKRAQANAVNTSKVYGLISDVSLASAAAGTLVRDGVLVATTTQWDAITGQTGGLTPAADYFLDPTAPGKLTTTAPSAQGQVLQPVGRAISTTDFDVKIGLNVLL